MTNIIKIKLFQNFTSKLYSYLFYLKQHLVHKKKDDLSFIENIDYFKTQIAKTKHALIKLSSGAWLRAITEYPNIKFFNYVGFTFEMVKALNENGYLVSICDVDEEFIATNDYDIFIGHGGKCIKTINSLSPKTKILQYVSGEYWKKFNEESEERYSALINRKKIKAELTYKRNLDGLIEGEEYITKKADIIFTANCPRMVDSFSEFKNKFFFTGWSAYVDPLLKKEISKSDFDYGRRNFIYVGGTNGNIQKGLDLLIEVFARTPDLHLYIYCKVEDEILTYYKNEFNLNNIHYIYHWRYKIFNDKLKELINRINYTLHAPINTGTGTAFNGSMGAGFIPVGYIDLVAPNESCVLTDSWQVEDLVDCVKKASNKTPEWCENAAELTIKNFNENWSVESFRSKFNEMIRNIDELPRVQC